MKKITCVEPHNDDIFLSAVSVLLHFPGTIEAFTLCEGDFTSMQNYEIGKAEFDVYVQKLNSYRREKGFGPYLVKHYNGYGDCTYDGIRKDVKTKIFSVLEPCFNDPVEFFLYPSESINPSHTLTKTISEGIMRAPYIFNIRTALKYYSAQEELFSISNMKKQVFKAIAEEDMNFIKELYDCFPVKLQHFPFANWVNTLRATGDKIGAPYAQAYEAERIVL